MKIAIDSNVFIYYLEDDGALGQAAEELLNLVVANKDTGVASELVYLEMLSDTDITPSQLSKIEEFLSSSTVVFGVVNKSVLLYAAKLRRKHSTLKAPDAIHLATAINSKCDVFVTNDKKLASLKQSEIKVVLLTDFRNL